MSQLKSESGRGKIVILAVTAGIACCVGLFGYLWAGPEQNASRFYSRSSGGDVLFDHQKHQESAAGCESCHHELVSGGGDCSVCHDDPDYTPDMAAHADLLEIEDHSCEGCHEIAGPEAARNCRECHPAAAVEGAAFVGCTACHDDPDYTPDAAGHDDLIAIDGHECEGCHTARTVADAFHANCSACHLAIAPERFAEVDGTASCRACHLK